MYPKYYSIHVIINYGSGILPQIKLRASWREGGRV